jgi:hypothetical protein
MQIRQLTVQLKAQQRKAAHAAKSAKHAAQAPAQAQTEMRQLSLQSIQAQAVQEEQSQPVPAPAAAPSQLQPQAEPLQPAVHAMLCMVRPPAEHAASKAAQEDEGCGAQVRN